MWMGMKPKDEPKKMFVYKDGRLYFTRMAERRFYFFLTVFMLTAGILYKIGIF